MAKHEPFDLRQSAGSYYDAAAKQVSRAKKVGAGLGRKAVDAAAEVGAGLREKMRTSNNARQAGRAANPLRSGTLLGPAIVAAPAVTETARAISQVSKARDEGVPVSRGLAFRRNLEALPGALIDAGSTVLGGIAGTPGGPAGMAAGALAGADFSRRFRRSGNRLVNAGLDKVFGTDLSTQDYSADGRIEEGREDVRRAADRKLLQDEGIIPGPRAAGPEGKISGLGTLDTAIANAPQSGNTLRPPDVQAAAEPTVARDPREGTTAGDSTNSGLPFGRGFGFFMDRARIRGDEDRATKNRLADATIQTANVKLASEQRAAQTAIDTKRRNAQSDLDGQVDRLFPDKVDKAGFAEFLGAMNPTALVDKGLLTEEQAASGEDFAELLVNLRARDPQSANKVLGEMVPLYRAYKQIQGGSGQGLANPISEGVPSFFDALFQPGGVGPGTALAARARSLNPFGGGGEFVNFEDGGQLDKRALRGQGRAGASIARGLRAAEENRDLIDTEEGRKLAIAGAKQRLGLR